MPCNSDHMEPRSDEKLLQKTAKLISYVDVKLKKHTPMWIQKESKDMYASKKELIPILCEKIKAMSKKQKGDIIYDAHSKKSRMLANWWERHLEADLKRTMEDNEELKMKKAKKTALAKLSKTEKESLGL